MHITNHGYRINQITKGSGYNWIFLPGGPGLGSEYLIEFCKKLRLPGNVLLLDFPQDGTNINGQLGIQNWQDGLVALLKTMDKPILVTHSFAGMFSLALPQIEHHLAGLVLMNTTPANTFFHHVADMRQKHHLPDLLPAASEYHLNPCNQTYKQFWDTYKYYCFTTEEMPQGEQMLQLLAFNSAAYHEAIQNFYPDYSYKWSPTLIPAMTITSENDYICPPQIFIENKQFQTKNILHKLIAKAGHCPWLKHFAEVQQCFDEFINLYFKDS